MAEYKITGDGNILHDGNVYTPGDTVEMSATDAAALLEGGRLEAVKKTAAKTQQK